MTEIIFKPIGVIHSPFARPQGTPCQPPAGRGVPGTIEITPELAAGLQDLEGFSHLVLIYYFHFSRDFSLRVKPYLDDREHGVFATRAPARPNAIGLSVVRLERIEGARLVIRDVDVVDGTPLLDIKPYIPQFDSFGEAKIGWLTEKIDKIGQVRDDGRFAVGGERTGDE